MAPFPDWSGVVLDLLLFILQRLPIPDVLRCEAICTTWAAAVRIVRSSRLPLPQQPPWLFIDIYNSDGSRTTPISNAALKFYSLVEPRRFHTVHLKMDPPISRCRCIGANDGWLILTESPGRLILLNPITGAKITDIPHTSADIIHKAAMSRNPLDGSWVVMAIFSLVYSPGGVGLFYARAGDRLWTNTLKTGEQYLYYDDVIYNDGLFYSMRMHRILEIWDFTMPSLPVMTSHSSVHRRLVCGFSEHSLQFYLYYASRFRFKIFKVYNNGQESEVTSLGNHAILDCKNGAIYISCAVFPEIKSNCIYSVTVKDCPSPGSGLEYKVEIIAHNIEDGSIVTACPRFPSTSRSFPTWLMPSFD